MKISHITKRLKEDKDYQAFFMSALTKFGVKNISDFKSEADKKKFFDYVDANWKGKEE